MRINFTDGYIIINEAGNTYCGTLAHEILHIANKASREYKVDFQTSLIATIKTYKRIKTNMFKQIKKNGVEHG